MKTRIIISIAAMLFCVALVAQTPTKGLEYIRINSTTFLENNFGNACAVKKGTATATNIIIPTTYEDLPVTSIGLANDGSSTGAFMDYPASTAVSITIPSSITTIQPNAFRNVVSLVNVSIAEGLTSICMQAFENCTNLINITLPRTLMRISDYAFEGCTSIHRINIPIAVFYIGTRVFHGCSGLTICAEAESRPGGWYSNWLEGSSATVIWGLPIPSNLQIESMALSWGAVENAVSYSVSINETTFSSATLNSFNLLGLAEGSYTFKVMAIGNGTDFYQSGWSAPLQHAVSNDDDVLDVPVMRLLGNYPNPFNPNTTLRFVVVDCFEVQGTRNKMQVTIDIYNLKGQKVKSLVSDVFGAGEHSVVWNGLSDDGKAMCSGMYFYRMTADGFTQTSKMVILK